MSLVFYGLTQKTTRNLLTKQIHFKGFHPIQTGRSSKYGSHLYQNKIHTKNIRCYAKYDEIIDWTDVDGFDKLNPSEEEKNELEKWWQQIQIDIENDVKLDAGQLPHIELPSDILNQHPLPQSNPSIDKIMLHLNLQHFRDEMFGHIKKVNMDGIFNSFIAARKEGYIPTEEMYQHTIAALLIKADYVAIRMLVEEMEKLNYRKNERVYDALITIAMIEKDRGKVEALWEEMESLKYEISNHLHKLKLLYLTRGLGDLDEALAWYKKMREKGVVKDSSPGNIMLHMLKEKKLWNHIDNIYKEMRKDGLFNISQKNRFLVSLGDEPQILYPKKYCTVLTYVLMCEIYCLQYNEEKAEYFRKKAEETNKLFDERESGSVLPKEVMEALITMYIHNEKYERAKIIIEELNRRGILPSRNSWKQIILLVAKKMKFQLLLEYQNDFECWGYIYDSEMVAGMMHMWYRCADYRRAKNLYDYAVRTGTEINVDARTQMLLVFEAAGHEGDVQKYYDEQIRAGYTLNSTMHEVMINYYLARGFPGSAKLILKRMEIEGCPASNVLIYDVIEKYKDMGGYNQVEILLNDLKTLRAKKPQSQTQMEN